MMMAAVRTHWVQELVDAVLRGRFDETQSANQTSVNKNKVIVFVSSTFTDTKTERNALIKGHILLCLTYIGQYLLFWHQYVLCW